MDSNVSKNTNSHNFFKLEIKREKLGISAKNLLKQELMAILNSNRQKSNVQIEQKSIASILENKINISNHKKQQDRQKHSATPPAETEFMPIVYSCPIGFLLETKFQKTPQIIMQQIEQRLISSSEKLNLKLSSSISIEIVDRGWINFYLGSKFMVIWLQQSFVWHRTERIGERQLAKKECRMENTPASLFPIQYIHARCCSLLNLGAREYSSVSVDPEWVIRSIRAKTFFWLDERDRLWFKMSAERNLLQQLLMISDFWVGNVDRPQWSKIALHLCSATDVFLADCRFLGEVKEQYPQLAIARLGLIALVQLWLQKILIEKLGVAAPHSM